MSENTNSLKIPNAYKRLHPVDGSQAVDRTNTKPEDLPSNAMVKYILRGGDGGVCRVSSMWWGDSPYQEGSIVAYKRIKLESPWVDWGRAFDREEELPLAVGSSLPAGLDPTVRVKVWLRGYSSPQADTRPASHWDWTVGMGNGGDIMRYRIVN